MTAPTPRRFRAVSRLRRLLSTDRGGSSTEYAIIVGLAAALALLVMLAARSRIEAVINSWNF